MKKIITVILGCCMLTACGGDKTTSDSSSNSDVTSRKIPPSMATKTEAVTQPLDMTTWQDNYRVFLTDLIAKQTDAKIKFNMADIDRDGTSELLYSEGDSGLKMLTFVDGEMKEVGTYGYGGKFKYNPTNGYVYSENENAAVDIYEYKNGVATKIITLENADDTSFKIDGADVTKEEYDVEYEKYYGDAVSADLAQISGTLDLDELQIAMVFNKK